MRGLLLGATIVLVSARAMPVDVGAVIIEAEEVMTPAPGGHVVSQGDNGTILLSGSVATIRGTTLRWEPQEKKRTLGFWTKAEDAAEWNFTVAAAGDFDVEVLQGCGKGQGGSEMTVTLDPEPAAPPTIRFIVEDTGGFQEFRPRIVGRLTLATGDHILRVKPEWIAKHAACDIRQIRLLPVATQ